MIELVQDNRVETYLQSHEDEEGTDMLAGIRAWARGASASLQRAVQQAVPTRKQQHAPAEHEGVSTADRFAVRYMALDARVHAKAYAKLLHEKLMYADAFVAASCGRFRSSMSRHMRLSTKRCPTCRIKSSQ